MSFPNRRVAATNIDIIKSRSLTEKKDRKKKEEEI